MKSTLVTLALVVLIAVVFSAPTNSNTRNNQFHELSESGTDNGKVEEAVRPGCNSQSSNNEQRQGASQSGNNKQNQGARQPFNNIRFHGFKPTDDNSNEVSHGPRHGFHFPTGVSHHLGDVTHEPGFFGRPGGRGSQHS